MCKVIHSTDGSCRLVDFYPLPRKTILFVSDSYGWLIPPPSLGSVQLVFFFSISFCISFSLLLPLSFSPFFFIKKTWTPTCLHMCVHEQSARSFILGFRLLPFRASPKSWNEEGSISLLFFLFSIQPVFGTIVAILLITASLNFGPVAST